MVSPLMGVTSQLMVSATKKGLSRPQRPSSVERSSCVEIPSVLITNLSTECPSLTHTFNGFPACVVSP